MTLFIWQEELAAKKKKLKTTQISQSYYFFTQKRTEYSESEKVNYVTLVCF